MSRRIECSKCGTINKAGTVCECLYISHLHKLREDRDDQLQKENIELKLTKEKLETAYSAIRFAVARFDRVSWGWDGDCGSRDIISTLEDILPENNV